MCFGLSLNNWGKKCSICVCVFVRERVSKPLTKSCLHGEEQSKLIHGRQQHLCHLSKTNLLFPFNQPQQNRTVLLLNLIPYFFFEECEECSNRLASVSLCQSRYDVMHLLKFLL